jgi:2-hydroxychromene-2-carboxylate isomerase
VTRASATPLFYYDFNSPYAYLAAVRIDEVLPTPAEWRPIAFGVIVRRLRKVPWSFAEDRDADFAEIAGRARALGLPRVSYPDGWPVENYSLTPLRAALLAADQRQLRTISRELFRTTFVEGGDLADVDLVLDAAELAGMDRAAVRAGIERPETKDRLRAATETAIGLGVTGVPTVSVGERLFWGDDRLEDAAGALALA